MPEGHTIHRAARDHHRIFAGKRLTISSPQGRFADEAALLSGRQCLCVEAFGKHLIYHFDHSDVLHIHLGLFGRIHQHKLPQAEPKGAVRLRLVGDTHVIDINGPTICQILPRLEFLTLIDRIGQVGQLGLDTINRTNQFLEQSSMTIPAWTRKRVLPLR